jgi:hypothetical protein
LTAWVSAAMASISERDGAVIGVADKLNLLEIFG